MHTQSDAREKEQKRSEQCGADEDQLQRLASQFGSPAFLDADHVRFFRFRSTTGYKPETAARNRISTPWTRGLGAQIHRHALALREALEHPLERVLATQPALLIAAVRLSDDLPEALID